MAKKRDSTNVAISLSSHEILREIAFKERKTIRSIIDELVTEHLADKVKGSAKQDLSVA